MLRRVSARGIAPSNSNLPEGYWLVQGRGEPSNVFGGVLGSVVGLEAVSGATSLKSLVGFDQSSKMGVANKEKNP